MVLALQGYYTLSQIGESEKLGQLVALSLLRELGPVVTRSFLGLTAKAPAALRRPALISEQIHFTGTYSLLIITVSGLFVGMMLALQVYSSLSQFGASVQLAPLVALTLLRELGPVV